MSGLPTPGPLCLQRAKSLWKGRDSLTHSLSATPHLGDKLVRETEKQAEFTKLTVPSGGQASSMFLHVLLNPPGEHGQHSAYVFQSPIPPGPANFSLQVLRSPLEAGLWQIPHTSGSCWSAPPWHCTREIESDRMFSLRTGVSLSSQKHLPKAGHPWAWLQKLNREPALCYIQVNLASRRHPG